MIAPALVPRKPGERIKTDRRDARKLAELHRAGLLTEVRPPTPAEEAVRDLCRARDDARAGRQRCRHRLGKLLLRRGLHYPGRAWTQAHRRWVNGLTWPHPADRVVLDDYLLAIDQLDARLAELDAQLATGGHHRSVSGREPVGWLRCFRGIDTLTAMLLLAELHDVQRFPTARALMAYLGLVPGEHSSGERHRRGPITKTSNTLAWRLVVEAAWHFGTGPASAGRWPSGGAGNRHGWIGVGPIPWTPILLARRRSPQCRSRDRRTRRHSDSRWSSWFSPDVHRESWLGSSSRRPRRYETGSRRLIATPESAPTA